MERVSKAEFATRLAAVKQGTYAPPPPVQNNTDNGCLHASVSRTKVVQDPFNCKTLTVKDIRGADSIPNIKPAKNVATDATQLSLPVAVGPNHPENTLRRSCDVVKHNQHAVELTGQSVFTKDCCSTKKGWTSGMF